MQIAEKNLRRPKIKEGLKEQCITKMNTAIFKAVIVGDPVPEPIWYLIEVFYRQYHNNDYF